MGSRVAARLVEVAACKGRGDRAAVDVGLVIRVLDLAHEREASPAPLCRFVVVSRRKRSQAANVVAVGADDRVAQPLTAQTLAEPAIDMEGAKAGNRLVSAPPLGFGCVQCHSVGNFAATQVFEAPGVNLIYTGERLQPTLPGVEEESTPNEPLVESQVVQARAGTRSPQHSDAPYCYQCGVQMLRAGSCHACPSCGTTSGCS